MATSGLPPGPQLKLNLRRKLKTKESEGAVSAAIAIVISDTMQEELIFMITKNIKIPNKGRHTNK